MRLVRRVFGKIPQELETEIRQAFVRGVARGLTAPTELSLINPKTPRYESGGFRSDWLAVGSDIRKAMRRINERTAA